jgi:hypothetical protein
MRVCMSVVSNQVLSVATIATTVATKVFLSPVLPEFEICVVYLSLEIHFEQLSVAKFKSLAATCGEWRRGWTTLVYV